MTEFIPKNMWDMKEAKDWQKRLREEIVAKASAPELNDFDFFKWLETENWKVSMLVLDNWGCYQQSLRVNWCEECAHDCNKVDWCEC